MHTLLDSFLRLKAYCEAEDFKGWDPYDGLKSKVARTLLPLKHSALLRLCLIQGFKRCPVNLRRWALVPKEYNAKGIGLFLQGYCNLYRLMENDVEIDARLGSKEKILSRIRQLADLLLELRSDKLFPGNTTVPAGATISTGRLAVFFSSLLIRQPSWPRISVLRRSWKPMKLRGISPISTWR